jgi:hypothetical protein
MTKQDTNDLIAVAIEMAKDLELFCKVVEKPNNLVELQCRMSEERIIRLKNLLEKNNIEFKIIHPE